MIVINGVIGSNDGEYSLIDIVKDYNKESEQGDIEITINSPGGAVDVAFGIYDFLRSKDRKIKTKCEGMCASAATILFLAGDERIAGCPLMIHNPWASVQGDSAKLKEASEWIDTYETKIEKFYASNTGIDVDTLSALMSAETYISPANAVELGFATSVAIIPQAYVSQNQIITNKKTKKMAKKSILDKIYALLIGEVKMLDLTAANGDIIVVEREEGTPEVGDAASPDGSHVMPDGSTIVVADGVITEIIAADAGGGEDEIEALKAQIAQLEADKAAALALAKSNDEIAVLNAVAVAGGIEWLAKQCSTYKPATRKKLNVGEAKSATAIKLEQIKKQRGV